LLPNDSVSRFAEELMSEIDDVMIVGHQPFVSRLAALLTTGSPDGMFIKFPTGAIVCLERSGKGFSYMLRFHVTSKLISRLIGD
jgi:phosphohistidine phosphatase